MFPQLEIPHTLAAGPGPGNTDPRVLARFAAAGVADHMQADVVRGMKEAKAMLREVFGTRNATPLAFVVPVGTGWIARSRQFFQAIQWLLSSTGLSVASTISISA